jgi:hypothetical protein
MVGLGNERHTTGGAVPVQCGGGHVTVQMTHKWSHQRSLQLFQLLHRCLDQQVNSWCKPHGLTTIASMLQSRPAHICGMSAAKDAIRGPFIAHEYVCSQACLCLSGLKVIHIHRCFIVQCDPANAAPTYLRPGLRAPVPN